MVQKFKQGREVFSEFISVTIIFSVIGGCVNALGSILFRFLHISG